jgi:uncharacterized protein YacL
MLGCLAGYVGGGVVGRLLDRALGVVERRAARLSAAQVVAGALGAFGGGMVALLVGIPIVILVPGGLGVALAGLLVWISLWLGFRVVGARSAAMFEMIGLSSRPLVRAQAYDAHDGLLLDSSVIMDGQLLGLARAGLLGGDLMVPRFVLSEVQGFADGSDETKARRAHRGLETLEVIKRDGPVRVYVLDEEVPELAEVDAKLAALARRLELRLLTNDAALGRIAELQGVATVNLRRLATDLAPAVMPGDFVRVFVTKRGRENDQGVGQLEDGSMVVVNGGVSLVGGPEVSLQVTSVVPTSMGRIVFTSVDHEIERGATVGHD